MEKNSGPERGFSLEQGKFSPGLLRALQLISDELSVNGVSARDQARKIGEALERVRRLPVARVTHSAIEQPIDLRRNPVDQYDLIAEQFGIVLIRAQRRVVVSE